MSSQETPARSRKRELAFALLTLTVTTIVCLVIAEYSLGWYQQSINNSSAGDPGLLRYHSRLGWSLTPGWSGRHRHHDFDVEYSINSYGFRGDFPETLTDKDRKRIAIVGDSFTFGLGVNDDETFTHLLNQSSGEIEFLNLSVPGYSTDQQLLLLQSPWLSIDADHYLVIIYLGNDLLDNMLDYPLQVEQAKPFYSIADKNNLLLNNVPVPRVTKPAQLRSRSMKSIIFGDELAAYESGSILNKSRIWKSLVSPGSPVELALLHSILDERLRQQKALMTALLTEIEQVIESRGATLRLGLLPGSSYLRAPTSYSAIFQDYVRLFLLQYADERGIETIDIAAQLRARHKETGASWYHPNEGHLNPDGHQIVSEILVQQLRQSPQAVAASRQ